MATQQKEIEEMRQEIDNLRNMVHDMHNIQDMSQIQQRITERRVDKATMMRKSEDNDKGKYDTQSVNALNSRIRPTVASKPSDEHLFGEIAVKYHHIKSQNS